MNESVKMEEEEEEEADGDEVDPVDEEGVKPIASRQLGADAIVSLSIQ